MGLTFIDSILILVAAGCGVFSAYFVGHALSSDHGGWAWITAAALLALAVILGFVAVRRLRRYGDIPDPPLS